MKPVTEHWFSLAEYDLETARAMLQSGRYLYVTFMCHITIEEALKGLIAEQQEEHPPRIHRLPRLAELAGAIDDMTTFDGLRRWEGEAPAEPLRRSVALPLSIEFPEFPGANH